MCKEEENLQDETSVFHTKIYAGSKRHALQPILMDALKNTSNQRSQNKSLCTISVQVTILTAK